MISMCYISSFLCACCHSVSLQPTKIFLDFLCNLLFATVQVADEVVVDRISGRRIDPVSGKIYHVKDLLLQCLDGTGKSSG